MLNYIVSISKLIDDLNSQTIFYAVPDYLGYFSFNPMSVRYTLRLKLVNIVNPIALRMAKTLQSLVHSECNRIKIQISDCSQEKISIS